MAEGLEALTEKEKETLRLIVRGHDAKSIANHLGLSVHTINERLRFARRKMAVSSSRAAARILLDEEGAAPQLLGDKDLRDAACAAKGQGSSSPEDHRVARPALVWTIGGTLIMSLLLMALLLSTGEQASDRDRAATSQPAVAPALSAAAEAAQRWLELLDAGDWDASWRETAQSFRDLNTVKAWQEASEQARVPLGDVFSRSLVAQESVPAPPHGFEVVTFRTSYANRPDAVERLSLAREGGEWKVAGIVIE